MDDIEAEVVARFSRVATSPEQEQVFPVGAESAKALGYDAGVIDRLPQSVTESFSGVGNPHSLGEYRHGQTVLDLGCGAGLDSIIAARAVGTAGKVIAIDLTEAMIDKARKNAEALDLRNIEFIQGNISDLPLENESADVAITNGVFNLCPDKLKVLKEVLRVLRPGGRLQMADILLEEHVSPDEVAQKGAWSD